jgi:hypothetical protein
VHYFTYSDGHVGAGSYAEFLEDLLERRLPRGPVVVVHDGGTTNRGEPLESLADDFDRLLGLHLLPPYAPVLNPVERLWDWLKCDELPNFAPEDVPHLDRAINARLFGLHHDQTETPDVPRLYASKVVRPRALLFCVAKNDGK